MSPALPLLELHAAVARLGQFQGEAKPFGPFDLHLHAGEQVAILGPSGAGKSTLLKLLAGDLAPHAGRVEWRGTPLAAIKPVTLAASRAVLPQAHGVAFGLNVDLVVGLGRVARQHDPQLPAIVKAALTLARAAHLAGRRVDTLSGGERARVQLARVFAQLWDAREGLLLVDEPLAALDPGLQFELMDAMQAFARARQHALVAVLHDINQALGGFERLWLIRQSRLVDDRPVGPEAIPPLAALYGIQLQAVDTTDGSLAVVASRANAAAQTPFQPTHI